MHTYMTIVNYYHLLVKINFVNFSLKNFGWAIPHLIKWKIISISRNLCRNSNLQCQLKLLRSIWISSETNDPQNLTVTCDNQNSTKCTLWTFISICFHITKMSLLSKALAHHTHPKRAVNFGCDDMSNGKENK